MVLAGPTASGKTDTTHQLALLYRAPVLSADSRQLFRGMRIGTAQPPETYTRALPYYFVDEIPPEQRFTAMDYRNRALQLLEELFRTHPVVFMTGGSGLYIDSLLYPKHDLPDKDDAYRNHLQDLLETQGLPALVHLLKQASAEKAAATDLHNPRRVMRALEILHLNRNETPANLPPFPYPFLYLGLDPGRETLYENINRRTLYMAEQGLANEVNALRDVWHCQALQTVGYREMIDYLQGHASLNDTLDKISQHTRNYAKRQMTWFRKNKSIQWFSPEDFAALRMAVERFAGKPYKRV